ncbi:TPA: AbrB/MazE/SpoVT family DNA-binding domain-containing protein [Candidatus Micrarchaeota archaeon]|nr:AbrB/MazE/SpoVT family DNA-binding domain-containing protein [Candidatus Micrarchaeota archaeon]
MEVAETTVSSKGQVVIPEKFRRELRLSPGSKLVFARIGSALVMQRLRMPSAKQLWNEVFRKGDEWAKLHAVRSDEDVVRLISKGKKGD